MRLRVLWLAVLMTVTLPLSHSLPAYAASEADCTLCILEIQTKSALSEADDFIIIGNTSSATLSLSSIQLQYLNSNGILDSKINLSGSLLPGQVKIYASDSIKEFNPTTVSSLPFAIYSQGGSLQLIKQLTSSTTVYDRTGWGSAAVYEGAPISIINNVYHLARQVDKNLTKADSGDNSIDFGNAPEYCDGLTINEVQPYVTDESGAAVEAWVELTAAKDQTSDCYLATNLPTSYLLPAVDLPLAGEAKVVKNGFDALNQSTLFQFPVASGAVALAGSSFYGGTQALRLPADIVRYNNLEKGQSWARVDEYGQSVWRKTFLPTPDQQNVLADQLQLAPTGDPHACEFIEISEFLPNPTGNDANSEWLELHNTSDTIADLSQCVLSIENDPYYFSADMRLGPGEFKKFTSLYTESGSEKQISLRNTDPTLITWSRSYGGQNTVLQSLIYENAPEAETYANFPNGWAWTYQPTPNAENVLLTTPPPIVVTDSPMPIPATTSVVLATTSGTKSSSSAKTTTKKPSVSATKVKAASTVATAKEKIATNSTSPVRQAAADVATTKNSTSPFLFVGIAALAILYAGYEYRSDISSRYRQWRRNRAFRRENRP